MLADLVGSFSLLHKISLYEYFKIDLTFNFWALVDFLSEIIKNNAALSILVNVFCERISIFLCLYQRRELLNHGVCLSWSVCPFNISVCCSLSKFLYPFSLLSAMYETFQYSTSSPTIGIFGLLNFIHSCVWWSYIVVLICIFSLLRLSLLCL